MLIVISNPEKVDHEAETMNGMFEEGLSVLHLRKPASSIKEMELLIQKIDPAHYPKIALHQHHHLAEKFGMMRLHFTETERRKLSDKEVMDFSNKYILSTSVHTAAAYENLDGYFAYCFLSPIFDSISKPGYKASFFDVKKLPKRNSPKLVALGGIDERNCGAAREMGFEAIAVLGAIWGEENTLEMFKKIRKKWDMTVQSS